MTVIPRRVRSSDGVDIAVHEQGEPGRPTIVAVHGYPDNHHVWDGVADLLGERYRVVTYDVRGTGDSDQPTGRAAYRMERLTDDFVAVLDAVSPDEPVHLLAHDWGSIQSWPALVDPRVRGRVLSFTSVSGPSLDHAGAYIRTAYRHPRNVLRQLGDSYYIGLFQLPVLPELAARSGVIDRAVTLLSGRTRSAAAVPAESGRTPADAVNGIQMYRANMLPRLGRPSPERVDIPVQVIAPKDDPHVSVALQVEAPRPFVADLRTRVISGGHWVVVQRPDVIARCVEEFLQTLDRRPAPQPREGTFAHKLVVVTGGARGIGRSTALEFARHGADVVVADINDVAAKETVDEVRRLGVDAWAYHLDVSDGDAWESFASDVRTQHGVPEVIVNNAGIGMGGPFLGTSVADWQKILGVNVWSVIHGCRLFATQMVARGEGGHIVNVASAAAYSPSIVYPAYATTKAAVLMLTQCLEAELAREDIGVTAVCPGFIDTDISKTTVHVGVDEAEARRRTEHQVASYQRRGYSPDKVAAQIVGAVAAHRPVAIITPEAKLFRAVSRLSPNHVGRRLARLDLNKI
jgi:NAD(P)-dependent dehydrogenase (short-subunit alcohol dehydrogenase family)/pimeloyl-ACP methyl ester carboxylesterase